MATTVEPLVMAMSNHPKCEDVAVKKWNQLWLLIYLMQPCPYAFSARSNLHSTVSCDVTERESPTFPRLRADNRLRKNAWGLGHTQWLHCLQ